MNSYLLVYDRKSGDVTLSEYPGPSGRAQALQERFRIERESRRDSIEVVVIAADSESDLKHTHSRYFASVGKLARAAGGRLAPAS